MTVFPKLTRRTIGWIMLVLTAVVIQIGVFLACVNNGTWVPLWFEGFVLFAFGGLWLVLE